ncbi:wat1-related protein [Quercus suber]|uniref:Wat1-related protein n=1 Tax=Quercus suber TaxID=58331 RepID=A0AAW0MD07_QUESU
MAENCCYKDVLPFSAMVAVECTNVVLNILFKAASLRGLSYYAFNVYSYALSTLLLLSLAFIIFLRTTELPTFKLSVLYRILLLGVLGSVAQVCGYKGIEYSSATLASAISNLTPAFTFILALIFRMEKLGLRSSSTQAKIMGTIVSISGAMVVVLYEGPAIIETSSQSPSLSVHFPLSSSLSNWVIGGLLLAVEYLLFSMWYIVQTQVMRIYPSELIVVFLYNLCATVISAPVSLLVDKNLSGWRLRPGIALVAIVYSGFASAFSNIVHTWGLHLKGPLYISIFRPLSIAIAAAIGVIFLGDFLYLGSVVGAIIISIGFYAVLWGKAKEAKEEEMSEDCDFGSLGSSSYVIKKQRALQSYNIGSISVTIPSALFSTGHMHIRNNIGGKWPFACRCVPSVVNLVDCSGHYTILYFVLVFDSYENELVMLDIIRVEGNLSSWILRPDITLVAVIYSGFFGSSFSSVIHTWCLHLKGPVYVSIFKPLSIVIAAAMGVIFLGDALYLGSVIGAIILSIGFYGVIWAKAKEELRQDYCSASLGSSSDDKTPLLDSYKSEDIE